MQIHPLHKIINNGEGECLDFKKTISSATKIAKTIVSFANHRGGTLLVGVNDNKTISGVRSEDEKYVLDLAAHFYCKPEIDIQINEWEIEKKTVLEVKIPSGDQKPYYSKGDDGKWWVYIRVKDNSLLASKVVVDVLKRKQTSQGSLIKYSKHESGLLKYLEKNDRVTLREVCKLLNISRWRAQKMLINLISAGLVRNFTIEKMEYYTHS